MSEDEETNNYSSSNEETDDNSDKELNDEDIERQKIRDNLSTLSFEELIKLKEKLGAKVYNETVYGSKPNKDKSQKEFKRSNKNRPREISSKIRPKRVGKLIGNNSSSVTPKSKKFVPRDPRFDTLCGEFDNKSFKQNYKFINDIRQKEKDQLDKEYRECTDPERKQTIKLLKQRIENQLRENEKIRKKKEKEENDKRELREKLKHGEKPVYKKKSVKRLEGLVEKYEELKKNNKLQKHIEKRTKKMKLKDKKIMKKTVAI